MIAVISTVVAAIVLFIFQEVKALRGTEAGALLEPRIRKELAFGRDLSV